MIDTIFALSSGAPPAAIAIVRISGPNAQTALSDLAGEVPEPRRARLRQLRDGEGQLLDEAVVLWFPGPQTATGEDLAELHLHGGRAVVAAVETRLSQISKLRRATPGEFTRRAFANGRIDLAEAEGLADLLSAETELQRRSAIAMAGGVLSGLVHKWREAILNASAAVEAVLDFSDEDDVGGLPDSFGRHLDTLGQELSAWLSRPRAETLKDGFKVVLAGPPNAGKSSLFNALVESEAAITAPVPGTTRDVITRPISLSGVPFVFADTAGLRDDAGDEIEEIGVGRARIAVENADLVLWLGSEGEGPKGAWEIEAQADKAAHQCKEHPRHVTSAVTGAGINALRVDLVETAMSAMPKPGEPALNARQFRLLDDAASAISEARRVTDPLLVAENLRLARAAFDALLGKTTTEDMLDALFGRFCIGK